MITWHFSTYPLHHLTGNFAVRTINNWVTICLLKALEHAWNSNHVCFVTGKSMLRRSKDKTSSSFTNGKTKIVFACSLFDSCGILGYFKRLEFVDYLWYFWVIFIQCVTSFHTSILYPQIQRCVPFYWKLLKMSHLIFFILAFSNNFCHI